MEECRSLMEAMTITKEAMEDTRLATKDTRGSMEDTRKLMEVIRKAIEAMDPAMLYKAMVMVTIMDMDTKKAMDTPLRAMNTEAMDMGTEGNIMEATTE